MLTKIRFYSRRKGWDNQHQSRYYESSCFESVCDLSFLKYQDKTTEEVAQQIKIILTTNKNLNSLIRIELEKLLKQCYLWTEWYLYDTNQ